MAWMEEKSDDVRIGGRDENGWKGGGEGELRRIEKLEGNVMEGG